MPVRVGLVSHFRTHNL